MPINSRFVSEQGLENNYKTITKVSGLDTSNPNIPFTIAVGGVVYFTINIDGTISANITGTSAVANKVANSVTFNDSGNGVAAGSGFDGSSAKTISYNTIGAASASHNHTSITGYSTALKSTTTTGLFNIVGPADGSTRTMTIPDSNFTVARSNDTNTFANNQTFSHQIIITSNNAKSIDSAGGAEFDGAVFASKAGLDNNTTQLATTSWFMSQLGSNTPQNSGIPAAGNSTRVSRENHVHAKEYTNLGPKAGTLNDNTIPIYATFNMSYMVSSFSPYFMTSDTDGREMIYYRASDGGLGHPHRYFKAWRQTFTDGFIFENNPVAPTFIDPSVYINMLRGLSNDYIHIQCSDGNQYGIIHNGDHDYTHWTTGVSLPVLNSTTSSTYDQISNSIIMSSVDSSGILKINLRVLDGTTGTQRGSTQVLFDYTNFDWTANIDSWTSNPTFRGTPIVTYNKDTGLLTLLFVFIRYYKTLTGSNSYIYETVTVNYNLTQEQLSTGDLSLLTPIVDLSTYDMFTRVNQNIYWEDAQTGLSYDYNIQKYRTVVSPQSTGTTTYARLCSSAVTPTAYSLINQTTYNQVFNSPDSSPWAKRIYQNISFNGNRIYFYGGSEDGNRIISSEYNTTDSSSNVVLTAGTHWLSSQVEGTGNQFMPGYAYDVIHDYNTGSYDTYYTAGPNNPVMIMSVTNGIRSFTNTGVTFPPLPSGYTNYIAGGYDPDRLCFWSMTTLTTNPDPTRQGFVELLKYSSGSWLNITDLFSSSDRIAWDTYATYSINSRGLAASVYSNANILIDDTGRFYCFQNYATIGSSGASPLLRVFNNTLTIGSFAGEASWGRMSLGYTPNTGVYCANRNSYNIESSAAEALKYARINMSRDWSSGIDLGIDYWFSHVSTYTKDLRVTPSVGLNAYIFSYPITLGGYYSLCGYHTITLTPNSDNYIYLQRDPANPNGIIASCTQIYSASGFSKVCIAKITTDSANIVSQETYPITTQTSGVSTTKTLYTSEILGGIANKQNTLIFVGGLLQSISEQITESVNNTTTSEIDTINTNPNQVVHEFNMTDYRSCKYQIQMTSGTSYHTTEVLVIHNGIDTFMTEFATIMTGASLGTLSSTISGGKIQLTVTPTNANTNVKVVASLMAI